MTSAVAGSPATSHRIPATLLPGDGIGPEIIDATLAALDALKAPFDWDWQVAGLAGVKTAGDPLPRATLDSRPAPQECVAGQRDGGTAGHRDGGPSRPVGGSRPGCSGWPRRCWPSFLLALWPPSRP